MNTYARIADGRVIETIAIDRPITDLFPEAMTFIDVTGIDPQPEANWTTLDEGETFAAPIVAAPVIDLAAYAAQARYAKEIGGVTVGTAQIDTSRESQAMIGNAYQFMTVSGATSTRYKTNSGWVTVTADQMKSIALAVGAHVQACFAVEADLDGKITAGTVTTTAEIDAAFASLAA